MTNAVFTYEEDELATPGKIDLLFDDMGLGKDDHMRQEIPEQKAMAREACKNFFIAVIASWGEENVTLSKVNIEGYTFYSAYLAGLAKDLHPTLA